MKIPKYFYFRVKTDSKNLTVEIEDASDVEVMEVQHGRWIIDKGLYKCSACNRLWPELWWAESVPLEKMLKWMPYCPNCGVKMDGDKNNGEI